jgi:hypothetical protein
MIKNKVIISIFKILNCPGGVVHNVVSSLPATKEIGAIDRKIEFHQGVHRVVASKKSFIQKIGFFSQTNDKIIIHVGLCKEKN